MTRVGSDKDCDGGCVDGNEADEDVRQEEADQHQQPRDWVVCKRHLLAVSIAHILIQGVHLRNASEAGINEL